MLKISFLAMNTSNHTHHSILLFLFANYLKTKPLTNTLVQKYSLYSQNDCSTREFQPSNSCISSTVQLDLNLSENRVW